MPLKFARPEGAAVDDPQTGLRFEELWQTNAAHMVRLGAGSRLLAQVENLVTVFDVESGPGSSWELESSWPERVVAAMEDGSLGVRRIWTDDGEQVRSWCLKPHGGGTIESPIKSFPTLTVIAPLPDASFLAFAPDGLVTLYRLSNHLHFPVGRVPLVVSAVWVEPGGRTIWLAGRMEGSGDTWGVGSFDHSSGVYKEHFIRPSPISSLWVAPDEQVVMLVDPDRTLWPASQSLDPTRQDVFLPYEEGFAIMKKQAMASSRLHVYRKNQVTIVDREFSPNCHLLGPFADGLLLFDAGSIWKLVGRPLRRAL